jgi:esterase/lipase
VPSGPDQLEAYVHQRETAHKLKPDNEARIVWADSTRRKTEYAIVYLHGFSASQFEGSPTHTNLAKKFGCNLYLARLAEHGIDTTDVFINLTATKYWESVKEAFAIAKQLGNKVIVMGTSTGGTNAIQLAANFPEIAGLVLLSPNIAINDPNAWVLNNHWGLQVAHKVTKSDYRTASDTRPVYKQYWNYHYRLEGAVALEEYLETTMTNETFKKVTQPVLLMYYYRDEQHQDPVVKVSAMLDMFGKLGTPSARKEAIAMPKTGDHVIASPFKSGDAAGVEKNIEGFFEGQLGLKPVSM